MDEDLRQLQREAEAVPHDGARGWRYARALERAGDRRGFVLELYRLARLSDAEARTRLGGIFPLPPPGIERERPQDRGAIPEVPRERRATFSLLGAQVIAVTDRIVFALAMDALVAIDAVALTESWRVSIVRTDHVGMRGEDAVVGSGEDLVLIDGISGAELARARLPGTILAMTSEGDRLVAVTRPTAGRLLVLVGVDVGRSFGRILWRRIFQGEPPQDDARFSPFHGITCGAVILSHGRHGAFGLENGAPHDEGASIARRMNFGPCLAGEVSREPSLVQGARRFTLSLGGMIMMQPQPPREYEILVESSTGRAVWPLPSPRREASSWITYARHDAELVGACGALYVIAATIQSRPAHTGLTTVEFVNVLAIDSSDGRIRVDRNLELLPVEGRPRAREPLPREFRIKSVSLEAALLVTVATPETLTVVRFD